MLNLTKENFKSTIEENKLVLVDFWAEWCVPCKMMIPVLEKLSDNVGDNAIISKLNVDEAREISTDMMVRSIPTMILFSNGKEIKRWVGFQKREVLEKAIHDSKLEF